MPVACLLRKSLDECADLDSVRSQPAPRGGAGADERHRRRVQLRPANRQGIIPLWVGEGDLPTPSFICEAAARSLAEGETFYTYQRGIPELRQAIARYHERVYGKAFDPERFFVTSGGMPAMQIAFRMVAGNGRRGVDPHPGLAEFRRRDHHCRRASRRPCR